MYVCTFPKLFHRARVLENMQLSHVPPMRLVDTLQAVLTDLNECKTNRISCILKNF